MSSRFRRISAPDDGVTLIELVVTMALMSLVVTSMVTFFSVIQRTTVRQEKRSQAIDEVRVVMDRMTKEVRQSEVIRSGSGASRLDMDTYVNGVATRIIYAVSGTSLTRTVGATTLTVLTRLTSTTLFTYVPNVTTPTLISLSFQVRPLQFKTDPTIISLSSDVRLRNQ